MQSSEKQSLRVLLTQRQGQGFSEADVREILQQVLPQLAQFHSEGKSHGTISIDTLVQRNGKIALALPLTPQPVSKARIIKDIYDLGVATIELLTAKAPNLLRNSDGSWNWEDNFTVTDQLAAVINRMLAKQPYKTFNSTNEVLSALTFTFYKPQSESKIQSFTVSINTYIYQLGKYLKHNWMRVSGSTIGLIVLSLWIYVLIEFNTTPFSIWNSLFSKKIEIRAGSNLIESIAISPDEKSVVSGDINGGIKVWNLLNGELLYTLAGHSKGVNSVAFSPDGKTIVSGSEEGTIKVWDAKSGKPLHSINAHLGSIYALDIAISPDSKTVISAARGSEAEKSGIRFWNLQTGELVDSLPGLGPIDINPDWTILTYSEVIRNAKPPERFYDDYRTIVRNLQTGEITYRSDYSSGSGKHFDVIGADGKTFLRSVYSAGTSFKVYDLQTSKELRTINAPSFGFGSGSGYNSVGAISKDGQILVGGTSVDWGLRILNIQGILKVHNLSTGNTQTLTSFKSISSFDINSKGELIVSGSEDGTIEIWEVPRK